MSRDLQTLRKWAGPLVGRSAPALRRAMLVLDIGGMTTVALVYAERMNSGAFPALEEIWRWLPPLFRSEAGVFALMAYLVVRGTYLSLRGRAFFDNALAEPGEGEATPENLRKAGPS